MLCPEPFDVVKTKMQADARYVQSSSMSVASHVMRSEGIFGLYRGLLPILASTGVQKSVVRGLASNPPQSPPVPVKSTGRVDQSIATTSLTTTRLTAIRLTTTRLTATRLTTIRLTAIRLTATRFSLASRLHLSYSRRTRGCGARSSAQGSACSSSPYRAALG